MLLKKNHKEKKIHLWYLSKEPTYEWTCVVQIHVIQRSIIFNSAFVLEFFFVCLKISGAQINMALDLKFFDPDFLLLYGTVITL